MYNNNNHNETSSRYGYYSHNMPRLSSPPILQFPNIASSDASSDDDLSCSSQNSRHSNEETDYEFGKVVNIGERREEGGAHTASQYYGRFDNSTTIVATAAASNSKGYNKVVTKSANMKKGREMPASPTKHSFYYLDNYKRERDSTHRLPPPTSSKKKPTAGSTDDDDDTVDNEPLRKHKSKKNRKQEVATTAAASNCKGHNKVVTKSANMKKGLEMPASPTKHSYYLDNYKQERDSTHRPPPPTSSKKKPTAGSTDDDDDTVDNESLHKHKSKKNRKPEVATAAAFDSKGQNKVVTKSTNMKKGLEMPASPTYYLDNYKQERDSTHRPPPPTSSKKKPTAGSTDDDDDTVDNESLRKHKSKKNRKPEVATAAASDSKGHNKVVTKSANMKKGLEMPASPTKHSYYLDNYKQERDSTHRPPPPTSSKKKPTAGSTDDDDDTVDDESLRKHKSKRNSKPEVATAAATNSKGQTKVVTKSTNMKKGLEMLASPTKHSYYLDNYKQERDSTHRPPPPSSSKKKPTAGSTDNDDDTVDDESLRKHKSKKNSKPEVATAAATNSKGLTKVVTKSTNMKKGLEMPASPTKHSYYLDNYKQERDSTHRPPPPTSSKKKPTAGSTDDDDDTVDNESLRKHKSKKNRKPEVATAAASDSKGHNKVVTKSANMKKGLEMPASPTKHSYYLDNYKRKRDSTHRPAPPSYSKKKPTAGSTDDDDNTVYDEPRRKHKSKKNRKPESNSGSSKHNNKNSIERTAAPPRPEGNGRDNYNPKKHKALHEKNNSSVPESQISEWQCEPPRASTSIDPESTDRYTVKSRKHLIRNLLAPSRECSPEEKVTEQRSSSFEQLKTTTRIQTSSQKNCRNLSEYGSNNDNSENRYVQPTVCSLQQESPNNSDIESSSSSSSNSSGNSNRQLSPELHTDSSSDVFPESSKGQLRRVQKLASETDDDDGDDDDDDGRESSQKIMETPKRSRIFQLRESRPRTRLSRTMSSPLFGRKYRPGKYDAPPEVYYKYSNSSYSNRSGSGGSNCCGSSCCSSSSRDSSNRSLLYADSEDSPEKIKAVPDMAKLSIFKKLSKMKHDKLEKAQNGGKSHNNVEQHGQLIIDLYSERSGGKKYDSSDDEKRCERTYRSTPMAKHVEMKDGVVAIAAKPGSKSNGDGTVAHALGLGPVEEYFKTDESASSPPPSKQVRNYEPLPNTGSNEQRRLKVLEDLTLSSDDSSASKVNDVSQAQVNEAVNSLMQFDRDDFSMKNNNDDLAEDKQQQSVIVPKEDGVTRAELKAAVASVSSLTYEPDENLLDDCNSYNKKVTSHNDYYNRYSSTSLAHRHSDVVVAKKRKTLSSKNEESYAESHRTKRRPQTIAAARYSTEDEVVEMEVDANDDIVMSCERTSDRNKEPRANHGGVSSVVNSNKQHARHCESSTTTTTSTTTADVAKLSQPAIVRKRGRPLKITSLCARNNKCANDNKNNGARNNELGSHSRPRAVSSSSDTRSIPSPLIKNRRKEAGLKYQVDYAFNSDTSSDRNANGKINAVEKLPTLDEESEASSNKDDHSDDTSDAVVAMNLDDDANQQSSSSSSVSSSSSDEDYVPASLKHFTKTDCERTPPKRKRGRPRKDASNCKAPKNSLIALHTSKAKQEDSCTKRKRGRPPKALMPVENIRSVGDKSSGNVDNKRVQSKVPQLQLPPKPQAYSTPPPLLLPAVNKNPVVVEEPPLTPLPPPPIKQSYNKKARRTPLSIWLEGNDRCGIYIGVVNRAKGNNNKDMEPDCSGGRSDTIRQKSCLSVHINFNPYKSPLEVAAAAAAANSDDPDAIYFSPSVLTPAQHEAIYQEQQRIAATRGDEDCDDNPGRRRYYTFMEDCGGLLHASELFPGNSSETVNNGNQPVVDEQLSTNCMKCKKRMEDEHKAKRNAEHKPEHNAEHKPDHNAEHKPEHNPEHKPEHNAEHKPEPNAEHKPEHNAEHKPEHNAEHKSEHSSKKKSECKSRHELERNRKRSNTASNNYDVQGEYKSYKHLRKSKHKSKENLFFYIDTSGKQIWVCPICGARDDGSPMIACDTCNGWFHWVCAGVDADQAKKPNWYCSKCEI